MTWKPTDYIDEQVRGWMRAKRWEVTATEVADSTHHLTRVAMAELASAAAERVQPFQVQLELIPEEKASQPEGSWEHRVRR
jgi:hypothetical protein